MSKNGMASFGRVPQYVNLTRLPTPKQEYTVNYDALTGGLNLYDPDYELSVRESPDMENMLWRDGTLCSRYGQEWLNSSTERGAGYTCYDRLFWGHGFFHIGSKIYYGVPDEGMALTELCDMSVLYAGYTPERGTFFRYGDDLMYKAPGAFVRIHYDGSGFTAHDVVQEAYTPITIINASHLTGSGSVYQPENRLSGSKTIWYNAGTEDEVLRFSGDGSATEFSLTAVEDFVDVSLVTVDGASTAGWYVENGSLHFYKAPEAGTDNIRVTCRKAVKVYKLPVSDIDSVDKVVVGGTELSAGTEYTADLTTGAVTFVSAPEVEKPFRANTVQITYTKANPDAFRSIMDCRYAIVYGGNQNICIVLGGCPAQPNAFFWNGNHIVMDPGYWPMEHYNLGGDTEEEITGFGKQQGFLVVFKNKSIGKCTMSFTDIDVDADGASRVYIEMDYTSINSVTGCDLPGSIQLIENNLVFCNTSQGVHIVLDSSSARENNVVEISRKVNGGDSRSGLIRAVRSAGAVSSFDDDHRYWLIVGSTVYCWDYVLSSHENPSWFYLTGIQAVGLLHSGDDLCHLDGAGRISRFTPSYSDYGEEYERRYQFATQNFRSYDRLKTVTVAIFTIRADTDSKIRLTYKTDYETRDDLTPLQIYSWRLLPRNLAYRCLKPYNLAYVARRKPGCIHVRHFAMVLTCTGVGFDMPILSAQVLYKYEGRDR